MGETPRDGCLPHPSLSFREDLIIIDNVTKVALAIVTVALVATLVVNYTGTASVITAGGKAFSGALGAAEKG